jgi:hypothetical protein
MATTYTLNSTGFEFSSGFETRASGYNYKVTTLEADGLYIGHFQFDVLDLNAFLSEPADQLIYAQLQMRVYDGDTGTSVDDIDNGQLVAAFGSPFIMAPELLLAGFDHNEDVTASNGAVLQMGTALGLRESLAEGGGWLDFYIYDTDIGGNNLYFNDSWEADFQLDLTSTATPVPEPASFFLLASGCGAVLLLRRRGLGLSQLVN